MTQDQLKLSQDQMIALRRQAVTSMAAIVVASNIYSSEMEAEEGNPVDITTYGTDATTAEAYLNGIQHEIADEVRKIQGKL